MVAAAAVAAAAVSAAGSMATASSNKSASGKAAGQQQAAYQQSRADLERGAATARAGLDPYANLGKSAANELAWQMGLAPPQNTPSEVQVPNTWRAGESGDPLWESILQGFNQAHQAKYGIEMNRPWESDADSQRTYAAMAQQYRDAKGKEPVTEYQGQGKKGWLNQQYGMDQYQNDPGYTPMVNSLEDLQNTPGYQFELGQGLQSLTNSAAGKGSLLSGSQIKDTLKYSQGVASTKYQDAWNRAQQAYQSAFSRDTQNKNNAFSRLQSLSNNGQQAASTQGNYTMNAATAGAGATQNNGDNQANLSLYNGQQDAAMYKGIANAATSGLGYYGANSGGGSLVSWFGGSGNTGYQASANGSNFGSMMDNAFSGRNTNWGS